MGTSLGHLELFLAVDGRVTAEEREGGLLVVEWLLREVVEELADGEVDVLGEMRESFSHAESTIDILLRWSKFIIIPLL
jgi:hypothetical protein